MLFDDKESLMDIATVDHLLTTTRSVRKRLDLARPVEPEVIERCLDAGHPGAKRLRPAELALCGDHRAGSAHGHC